MMPRKGVGGGVFRHTWWCGWDRKPQASCVVVVLDASSREWRGRGERPAVALGWVGWGAMPLVELVEGEVSSRTRLCQE